MKTVDAVDSLETKLARAKAMLRAAEDALSLHRAAIEEIEREIITRDWGVRLGSVVMSDSTIQSSRGKLGKIIAMEPCSRWDVGNRPNLTVVLANKDGSFGRRQADILGDWHRVGEDPDMCDVSHEFFNNPGKKDGKTT